MFLPSNITLKFGDSGDFVAELQRRLAMVHCFTESQVNGFFDGATVNGVTSFQGREGLHADGVAGPETLRRLNGVIAGDSSGGGDKKEEEATVAAPQATDDLIHAAQVIEHDPFAYAPPTHSPYGEEAYQQPAIAAPEPAPPLTPLVTEQQRANEQMQRDAMQQPAANAHDILAQMLLQSAQPMPAASAPEQPHRHERPPLQPEPIKPTPPLEIAVKETEKPEDKPEKTESKSIVGKVRHFANAMVQKMADYFEAKLPPSVLSEVQSIGLKMAQSGMKEVPLPTGPDLPSRAPELPTRAPEPNQQRV